MNDPTSWEPKHQLTTPLPLLLLTSLWDVALSLRCPVIPILSPGHVVLRPFAHLKGRQGDTHIRDPQIDSNDSLLVSDYPPTNLRQSPDCISHPQTSHLLPVVYLVLQLYHYTSLFSSFS